MDDRTMYCIPNYETGDTVGHTVEDFTGRIFLYWGATY